MARRELAIAENALGELFVDDTCIECDTCRELAPEVFGSLESGQSFVQRQPWDGSSWRRALHAMVSCPTSSIGAERSAKEAARDLPGYDGFAQDQGGGKDAHERLQVGVESGAGSAQFLDPGEPQQGTQPVATTRDVIQRRRLRRNRHGVRADVRLTVELDPQAAGRQYGPADG